MQKRLTCSALRALPFKSINMPSDTPTVPREQLIALLDLLSFLYLRYGKPERARDYLNFLVSIETKNSRFYRALAAAEVASGNPDGAYAAVEKSLRFARNAKDRASGYLLLSRILLKMNRPDAAREAANRFLDEQAQA